MDASTALAWCFPDETSDYAETVLVALEGGTLLVPAIWSLEIANAMLVGERRKRLGQPELRLFAALLESLTIAQDVQPTGKYWSHVLPLARENGLSAYDAAYLELAIRHNTPLASLDDKLRKAAKKLGVKIFAAESGTAPRATSTRRIR